MKEYCQIPNAIERIFAASYCNVGFMGGSLTIAAGAGDSSRTSWRGLFIEYLYTKYHPKYQCQISEVMGALGASESYASVFYVERNILQAQPALTFVEFCVNDSGAPDKDLVFKGMEGIVRKLLTAKLRCEVIILGMGNRKRDVDHSLHRQIADYYDLPFIDVQDYIFKRLEERGETWDNVTLEFEENDSCHLNDYGNQLCFEAMRECFEEQIEFFVKNKRRARSVPLPDPIVSDEFQFTRMVNPSRKKDGVVLEGEWERKSKNLVPWYFDNLLMGQPGASMTLNFKGTAAAVFGLMYHNGLKVEAVLDGKEIPGPYFKHVIEFGKGLVIAHGLPDGEHCLKLTVAQPSARHNKLKNPTAQIAYIGIASRG